MGPQGERGIPGFNLTHRYWTFDWSADGSRYTRAPVSMRLGVAGESGAGAVQYATAPNGSTAFTAVTLPFAVNAGDTIRATATGVVSFKVSQLARRDVLFINFLSGAFTDGYNWNFTYPSGLQTGDAVLVTIALLSTTTLSVPAGFTLVASAVHAAAGCRLETYRHVHDGSRAAGSVVPWNGGANPILGIVNLFRGVRPGQAYTAVTGTTAAPVTSYSLPRVTTTEAFQMAMYAVLVASNADNPVPLISGTVGSGSWRGVASFALRVGYVEILGTGLDAARTFTSSTAAHMAAIGVLLEGGDA